MRNTFSSRVTLKKMSTRPGSSSGRPGSAARPIGTASGNRPPGTATRLTTGMAPTTAGMRGGMTGGGVALSSQVQVADRPMTQQGLGGMKTGQRRMQRQVQDKTYFLGLLRSKIAELTTEINRLRKEVEDGQEDQSSFVTYEKRAEALAADLKELQGELGNYNTLVDKMNTGESSSDIQREQEELKAANDRETRSLEALFEQKKDREMAIQQLDVELRQEKSMTDNLVGDMKPDMRQKYMQLKDINEHLIRQLEDMQQQLDQLNTKKAELEEELSNSPVKQEAVRLYEQLHELEEKRDQLAEEALSRGSPQEEREKLLRQVKEDNQEIASMERQTNELREKLSQMAEEIRQVDMDIEENQGERNLKYKELKKREETMNEFLDTFEENKASEIKRSQELEQNIVVLLEHMSRRTGYELLDEWNDWCDDELINLQRFGHLPTPQELSSMKEDLAFKETEMSKSEHTASGLAGESEKLAQDLAKVEQLESKITTELDMLKSKIEKQTEELDQLSDIPRLREEAEDKKQRLAEDKLSLHTRRSTLKKATQQLTSQYEALKAQLSDNETFTQLGNLERKWQHHEQNNYVMKEYIASKTMECDFRPLAKHVSSMISEYNKVIQDMLAGKGGI